MSCPCTSKACISHLSHIKSLPSPARSSPKLTPILLLHTQTQLTPRQVSRFNAMDQVMFDESLFAPNAAISPIESVSDTLRTTLAWLLKLSSPTAFETPSPGVTPAVGRISQCRQKHVLDRRGRWSYGSHAPRFRSRSPCTSPLILNSNVTAASHSILPTS